VSSTWTTSLWVSDEANHIPSCQINAEEEVADVDDDDNTT
jgi:hypothetical protein